MCKFLHDARVDIDPKVRTLKSLVLSVIAYGMACIIHTGSFQFDRSGSARNSGPELVTLPTNTQTHQKYPIRPKMFPQIPNVLNKIVRGTWKV